MARQERIVGFVTQRCAGGTISFDRFIVTEDILNDIVRRPPSPAETPKAKAVPSESPTWTRLCDFVLRVEKDADRFPFSAELC